MAIFSFLMNIWTVVIYPAIRWLETPVDQQDLDILMNEAETHHGTARHGAAATTAAVLMSPPHLSPRSSAGKKTDFPEAGGSAQAAPSVAQSKAPKSPKSPKSPKAKPRTPRSALARKL
jgi:hypothetical protein